MENTLNKTELAGALSALGKLVCRTSPIPMYHAVQIESINNALFFRTHNSDEEIEFCIPCLEFLRLVPGFSPIP